MRDLLARLVDGIDLSRDEAREGMGAIMRGEATPSQIAGLLVALRMKGETVEEITGFAEAMRAAAHRVDLGDDLVDTCGTGGDGANTFNISTAAALVAAAAGARVAKHGNRAVSSACGSADVLEALGVSLTDDPAVLRRSLEAAGIAFLFAPHQHPAMKHAVGPRRELGLRTAFNLLGPLTNPAGARRQVLGVYDPDLVEPLATVLGLLGAEHALVVHGGGGLDEISTLGPTRVAEWHGGEPRTFELRPGQLGLSTAMPGEIRGGDVEDNARLVREILDGQPGPAREIVLANAGAAIYVAGIAGSLEAGVRRAATAVDDGAARRALDRLVAATGGAS